MYLCVCVFKYVYIYICVCMCVCMYTIYIYSNSRCTINPITLVMKPPYLSIGGAQLQRVGKMQRLQRCHPTIAGWSILGVNDFEPQHATELLDASGSIA